jgi:hypothetical protein
MGRFVKKASQVPSGGGVEELVKGVASGQSMA